MPTQPQAGPEGGLGTAPRGVVPRPRPRAGAGKRRTVGRADRDRPLRLSAGQQQMWVLHKLDPAGPAYLMTWALRLSGRLDPEAMRLAWERIVERHEILRTRYAQQDGEPVQIIDPPARFDLHLVDLAALPTAGREDRARQIAAWEQGRPFDLTGEHPLRVTLIALGADEHFLLVHMHHIACDDSSYLRLSRELSTLYAAFAEGRPADLPPALIHYADYAAWELDCRRDGLLRRHLDYWSAALKDVTELPLPLDRARTARPDAGGGAVEVVIKPATAEAVRALASAHRASPYMVLLASYHAVLADLSGSDDVTVGIPVSGRTTPELDDLIGYTVNTVVIRSRHHDTDTFAQLLDRVREQFLDAFDHRAAPFKWVVEEVNPTRATAGNPLFQAAFDMDTAEEGSFSLPGLRVEQLRLHTAPSAKFDLTLHIRESADGRMFGQFDFAAAVIDEETAREWAERWGRLLDAVMGAPDEPLVQLLEPARKPGRQPAQDEAGVDAADAADAADGAAGEYSTLGAENTQGAQGTQGEQDTHDVTGQPTASDDAATRDRVLAAISRTWSDVLGGEFVDIQDNFFDVGGDSLRAIALSGRLKEDGLDVSSADIFAYQTIEDLAEAYLSRPERAAAPGAPAARPAIEPFALLEPEDRNALPPGVADAYPLAAMQLGMLVELRSRPDVNTYQDTTSYLIRAEGAFDPAALQAATQRVVDRHEVLRTGFDLNTYSVPLQLVRAQVRITVGVTAHGVLGDEGWAPRLRAFADSERRSLIDPAHAPLIRVHAHTASDTDDWCVTITECHPILEGWSFHTMLMEILTGYRDLHAGGSFSTPEPVPFRYADYIAAELAAVRSPEHRTYWRSVVEGRADAVLPTAWQDTAGRRDRYQVLVNYRDLEDDLRRLAAHTRTSMKAVLLAAHMKVMSMVVGSEEFFTGLVCDARPEVAGAERVLGMYLNTLPFAMPAGARSWGGLVTAVYDSLTEMWPHRILPVQVVQQEAGRGGRLLEVFFNYLDFHQVDGALIDVDQTYNDNENEFALHVFTTAGVVKLNTVNHFLSREAADRMCALYRTVLEEMSRGPEGDACVPCLPPQQARQVRVLGGDRDDAGRPAGLAQSFARQVAERPDAAAVRCGGESLTYAELNAWADRIADRLRGHGVEPGGLVAVVPGHDAGTVACLLAVWKAGAAWIALEAADVARRLRGPDPDTAVAAVLVPAPGTVLSEDLNGVPVVVARGTWLFSPPDEPSQRGGTPPTAARPQDRACVLPAGTSAGVSEGMMVFSHRALAQTLESVRAGLEAHGAAPARHTAWLCPDLPPAPGALAELLAPLMSGAAIVLASSALPEAITEIRGLIAAGTVTHVPLAAPAADRVLGAPGADRITAIVGDARPGSRPDPADPAGRARVIPAGSADAVPGWLTLGGRPLPGVTVRVLDTRLRPAPVGVVGELCVGGSGLPDALYGDPAGTAAHLVPDPFGDPGSRLLRTGTLARFAADGTLEQLGLAGTRTPEQAPPAELYRTRELLNAQPSVLDSLVLLRPASTQEPRQLLGYLRVAPGARIVADDLRRSLIERRLPRHLVPDALIEVDSWPLTARGTINTDLLPEPARFEEPDEPGPPWDKQFEDVIQASLPSPGPVMPDIALADSGLDSLAAVGLLVALEKAYNVTLPDDLLIVDMFRTPRELWNEFSKFLRESANASD